jgi:MFS family permease
MDEKNAGLGFATMAFSFGLGAPLMGFLCQHIEHRKVMLACIVTEGLALFLVGPTKFLHTESLVVVFIGLTLNGLSVAGLFVPIIPVLVQSV